MSPTRLYLDYNATTPLHPLAQKRLASKSQSWGNPSSLHSWGREAKEDIEASRAALAAQLAAESNQVIFTSGGTESNNIVLRGIAGKHRGESIHILSSAIEHASVTQTCRDLEKNGVEVSYLPVDDTGVIDSSTVADAIRPNTKLISIMMVNNETGSIQPIAEIGKIARKHKILFHTDAVQAFGKQAISVNDLNVDFLSLSGHKLYAPKGIGALYCRNPDHLMPMSTGGGHEYDLRPGTENLLGITAWGAVLPVVNDMLEKKSKRLGQLKQQILSALPTIYSDYQLNGPPDTTLSTTLNVGFPGLSGESLMMGLDMAGIAVSTGSACSTGTIEPSHVLLAMGRSRSDTLSAIRISLGWPSSERDIEIFLKTLGEIIDRMQA